MVILPRSSAGLWHLPILFFCFTLLFITICCTDFYLIVLCSSLLISFLFNSVPALYSTNGSCCIPALHLILLPCSRGGPRLSSSYCFVWDYPFINQIFHFFFFPSSHFAQVSECSPVSCYQTGWNLVYNGVSLSLSSCTDQYTPVHSTTCNSPVGWHHASETFHYPNLSLYKLCITTSGFLLGSWTLTMGSKGCPKTSVGNYSNLLCINPQEHISLLLCFGSGKSCPEDLC